MTKRPRQRGVSLLEALVSLAVMAIGAVAVVAMQATLRSNADIAKQRSEAVRLAQLKMEEFRSFRSLGALPGQMDWTDVVDTVDMGIVGSSSLFDRRATVATRGGANDDPLSKSINIAVTWTDRTGQDQTVVINSMVSGVPPELAGSLSVDLTNSALPQPGGRHPAIPPEAISQTGGTSTFTPPGAPSGTVWTFDNLTGLIRTIVCPSCPWVSAETPPQGQLVTGFVRFALGAFPGPAQSESPSDAPMSIGVKVVQTSPVSQDVPCFESFGTSYVQYFCAVPLTTGAKAWSGRVEVDSSTISLESDIDDDNASKYKVCRYTPVRGCHPTVGSVIWGPPGQTASCSGSTPTPQRKMSNQEHPRNYLEVDAPLTNQNFLVIRAGNGDDPYQCPNDNTATPAVLGTTWYHQPSS